MKNILIIYFLLHLISPVHAALKDQIILNLKKTENLTFDFKQTIGRGTRLNLTEKPFQHKYWFTILDYRGSSELFFDPAFDGITYLIR